MTKPKLTKENIATIQDALFIHARHQISIIHYKDSPELAKSTYNKIADAYNAISEFDVGKKHIEWSHKFKEKGGSDE